MGGGVRKRERGATWVRMGVGGDCERVSEGGVRRGAVWMWLWVGVEGVGVHICGCGCVGGGECVFEGGEREGGCVDVCVCVCVWRGEAMHRCGCGCEGTE